MKSLLVSVIVATYRRTGDFRRALQSLRMQTYTNIEVIVVDDNTDISFSRQVKAICDEFISQMKINQIRDGHGGHGSAKARNLGICAACGEYVTFLDDDDVYLPLKIERQFAEMQKSGADFSATDLALYSEADKMVEYRSHNCIGKSNHDLFSYHLMHHLTGTDTFMFKTDYLRKIGGFPPIDIGDEFYLMCEAILKGGKCVYIPECHIKAYIHDKCGGLSSSNNRIEGEKKLYDYKKMNFEQLNWQEKRYIRMRHHAVLAFVWGKSGNAIRFLTEAAMAMFCAPLCAMQLFKASSRKLM